MPIFMCHACGCIENTALSNYWVHTTLEGKPGLCSACDPEIGKWHGEFPQRSAAGMLVDQSGHLWSSQESVPKHYQIMGSASQPHVSKGEEGNG
ncbi:hypothetical protein [Massilia sp. TN1-12]|uniref:hypothetical protein n=1 Tax=Massilia paldalensis TaxID=3377675 RepID=UPI00384AD19E